MKNKISKEEEKMKKKFCIDNVSKFCDKCGNLYNLDDVQIVQEGGHSLVVHFFCRRCKAENVANFLSPIGLITKFPINSDLNLKELKVFSENDAISLDDVLEVYLVLRSTNGVVEI